MAYQDELFVKMKQDKDDLCRQVTKLMNEFLLKYPHCFLKLNAENYDWEIVGNGQPTCRTNVTADVVV